MKVRILSFTDRGEKTAEKLAEILGSRAERCERGCLGAWTKEAFTEADAICYVGAVGIAVRAIAPFVKSKLTDPAILAVDEQARYVIPLLSGHIGGANLLARELAEKLEAEAIITTATDLNDCFAVDSWAVRENCHLLHPERIRDISGRLLSGKEVICSHDFEIEGPLPKGVKEGTFSDCDFALTIYRKEREKAAPLLCVPRILVLGIGCKKGKSEEEIEEIFSAFIKEQGLLEEAIGKVCSIDLKKEEPGLLAFCKSHGWDFETFSAEEMEKVEGEFTASDFVKERVGVDNVCERSALLGSRSQAGEGSLLYRKKACWGVTLAVAQMAYHPKWE